MDEIMQLEEEIRDLIPDDNRDLLEEYQAYSHETRILADDESDHGLPSCSDDEDCPGTGLTCMRLTIRRKSCVPLRCFQEIAAEYRETTMTDDFMRGLFDQAGTNSREVASMLLSKRDYRRDPRQLMTFDNPFSRFQEVFNANAPDMTSMMQRTIDCMPPKQDSDPTDPQQTVQGVVFQVGVSYGAGAGVRMDCENTWGTGTGDIGGSVNGTVTQFVPSAFFAFSASGFFGIGADVSATFSWTFTGTKEDIPFDYLIWGMRAGASVHGAIEGHVVFPAGVPGIQLEAGLGGGGGVNVGYKRSFMVFNGTQIVDTNVNATEAPMAP